MMIPSLSLAFLAGLVSFLSPCVLPLVPAYVGYMSGRVTATVSAQVSGGGVVALKPTLGARFSTLAHGVAFVLGFTLVFVGVGLAGTAFVSVVGGRNIAAVQTILSRAGGILIIIFGLHFMGALRWLFIRLMSRRSLLNTPLIAVGMWVIPTLLTVWIFEDWLPALPVASILGVWLVMGGAFTQPQAFWVAVIGRVQSALYADTRRQMVASGRQGYGGSVMMGIVFAAGWTPCIGPIYGSILTMAASGGDVTQAGTLLVAYSLGLGIPFLVAALALDGTQSFLRRVQKHLRWVEVVAGAFLILIGVLIASGRLQELSQTFANEFADFSYQLEECAVELYGGQIAIGDFVNCVSASSAPAVIAPAIDLAVVPAIGDLAAIGAPAAPTGLNIGEQAPVFTSVNVDGVPFDLDALRGQVVLLNFWATWCGPCRIEMPEFQAVYDANRDQGFVVVGVNFGENVEAIASFRDQFALDFPLVMDESGRINDQFGVRQYPSTLILDRDGVIRARHLGALRAEDIPPLLADALGS